MPKAKAGKRLQNGQAKQSNKISSPRLYLARDDRKTRNVKKFQIVHRAAGAA